MIHTRSALLLGVMTLTLTGCVTTRWEKPGATQSEFEQIKAVCMMEGHERVPARERTVLVSDGSVYKSGKCKDEHCSSYSSYSPPRYDVVDDNADLRDQIVKACFYRNGWQLVRVEQ